MRDVARLTFSLSFPHQPGIDQPHPLPREVVREGRRFELYAALHVLLVCLQREVRAGDESARPVDDDALRAQSDPSPPHHLCQSVHSAEASVRCDTVATSAQGASW
jgi:hypothetical protein